MLGNISYKRKIGKNTKLLFQMQGKNHKKWWFCLGVRIGESMLGNRFLKIVQKPQKNPQKSKDLVILLLKSIRTYEKWATTLLFLMKKWVFTKEVLHLQARESSESVKIKSCMISRVEKWYLSWKKHGKSQKLTFSVKRPTLPRTIWKRRVPADHISKRWELGVFPGFLLSKREPEKWALQKVW